MPTLAEVVEKQKHRYYQTDGIVATMEDHATDCPEALVSMPTATGKTRFFIGYCTMHYHHGKSKILLLAPAVHLVDQPLAEFKTWFKPFHRKAKLSVMQGARKDMEGDITFATVQTLYYNGFETLKNFLLAGQRISLLIVDETHHIVAPSYFGLLQRLKSVQAWKDGYQELLDLRDWLKNEAPKELAEAQLQMQIAQSSMGDDLTEPMRRLKKVETAIEKAKSRSERWSWMDGFDFDSLAPHCNVDMLTLGVTATPFREKEDENLAIAFPKVAERDDFTYIYPVDQAQKDGFLCQSEALEIKALGIDLEGIKVDAKDGDNKWGEKLTEAGNWPHLLTDFWLQHSNPDLIPKGENGSIDHALVLEKLGQLTFKQAMVFMPTVESSKGLIQAIGEEYNLPCAHTDGKDTFEWDTKKRKMKKIKRTTAEKRFKAGELVLVSNYNVWTEGMDFPHMEYLWLIRATKSQTAFMQMFGRILRLDPDNPDKIAYVVSPNFKGMRVVNTTTIGKPIISKKQIDLIEQLGQLVVKTARQYRCPDQDCKGILEALEVERRTEPEYKCKKCQKIWGLTQVDPEYADLLDASKPSGRGVVAAIVQLFQETELAWTKRYGIWCVGIGTAGRWSPDFPEKHTMADRTLFICPPGCSAHPKIDPDSYFLVEISKPATDKQLVTHNRKGEALWKPYTKYYYGGRQGRVPIQSPEFSECLDVAEKIIADYRGPDILTDKNAKWRQNDPSVAVMNQLLERFRIPKWELYGDNNHPIINMGEASQLFSLMEGLEYMTQAHPPRSQYPILKKEIIFENS